MQLGTRRLRALTLAALSLNPAISAWADTDCVELARIVAYNEARNFSSSEISSLNKADFCSEKYTNNQVRNASKIEASYKAAYSIDVSGAISTENIQQTQDKECNSQYGAYWQKMISEGAARTASREGQAIIDKCLELKKFGYQEIKFAADKNAFNFSFRWRPENRISLKILKVGPPNFTGYSCSMSKANRRDSQKWVTIKRDADTSSEVVHLDTFNMQCSRPKVTEKTESGVDTTCSPSFLFSLASSNADSLSLNIPKYCEPRFPGRALADANAKIAELKSEVSTLKSALDTSGSSSAKALKQVIAERDIAVTSLQNVPIWISSGTYFDKAANRSKGNYCEDVCRNGGRTAVTSGNFTGPGGGEYLVCRANVQAEGSRPGFQMKPRTDNDCNVGWGTRNLPASTFDCLCK